MCDVYESRSGHDSEQEQGNGVYANEKASGRHLIFCFTGAR